VTDRYKHPKWQKKRLHVLERDGWKCVACLDGSSTLHVHHKRYLGDPWDVTDDDLQTLCERCHSMLGPHPKAGVWWERTGDHAAVVVEWCPVCGSQKWKDKGSYNECMFCSFRTELYIEAGGYGLRGSKSKTADWMPLLPAWDREVIEVLTGVPGGADFVIREVDPSDLDSPEARAVFEAARRLSDAGRTVGLTELLLDLPDPALKSLLVAVDQERHRYGPSAEPRERIDGMACVIRRRAARAQALASARAIKTSRLDSQSEAELLERLVAQRRAAQGMNSKERAIHEQ